MGDEQSLVGRVLGDTYRLERWIGEGGMGAVYEASHLRLRRRFAIKLLVPAVASDPEALARFRREAEITSELGHPNIVEVVDFNSTPEGSPYIVMELLEGESLSERLQRVRLAPSQVAAIVHETAAALQAAHGRGIIHRDLKPQNIFLWRRADGVEVVKVLDFGISKVLGSQSVMTGVHSILGTPSYMAPEQAQGRAADVDARTDVFAFGAILYEILGGRPPFVGEALGAVLYQVVHEDPPPLRSLRPDTLPSLEAVVRRALNKRPDDRFASADELRRAFDDALAASAAPGALLQRELEPTLPFDALLRRELEPTLPPVASPPVARLHVASPPIAPLPVASPPVAQVQRTTLSAGTGELRDELAPRTSALRGAALVVALGVAGLLAGAAVTYLSLRGGKGGVATRAARPRLDSAPPQLSGDRDAGLRAAAHRDAGAQRVVLRPDVSAARRAAARPDAGRRSATRVGARVPAQTPARTPAEPGLSGAGTLSVNVQRRGDRVSVPASVFLDGRSLEQAPVVGHRTPAGRHQLEVRLAGFRVVKREIFIQPNKKTVQRVLLDRE